MSASPVTWTCDHDQSTLTVGAPFTLRCKGEAIALNRETLKIIASGESPAKYRLQLLKVENLSPESANLNVTSYLVGDHPSDGIMLTDGNQSVVLSGFSFKVASSIQAQQGEQPQPYGPFEPLRMKWGLPYILIVILAALVWLFIFYRKLRKHLERRKLFKNLDQFGEVRSPFDEFHRQVRMLNRKRDLREDTDAQFLEKLSEQFRLYLVREFRIPAMSWSPSLIATEFLQYHNYVQKKDVGRVRQFLSEVEIAIKSGSSIKEEDVVQLIQSASGVTEKLDRAAKAHRKMKEEAQ